MLVSIVFAKRFRKSFNSQKKSLFLNLRSKENHFSIAANWSFFVGPIRNVNAVESQTHGSWCTPNIKLHLALLFQISSALCCLISGECGIPCVGLLKVLMGPGLVHLIVLRKNNIFPTITPLYSPVRMNERAECS